jgi:hypothetical protein
MDADALQEQYKSIFGKYGPRQFLIENGKLYYKREKLPKIHILPISEDRYISLTRYATNYGFETTENNETASVVYTYDVASKIWTKLTRETNNYFLKNE